MFRNNKILQLVIAACLLISSTTVIAQTWTSVNGPQIATNVKDISLSGNFVYIAENDYLLKSTNGGTAWRATQSTVSGSLVTLCKPDNANIVMASGLNFFKRSVDGGVNWTIFTGDLPTNLTPLRLSASPVNTSNMFLGRKYDASTRSVWRSDQAGATWNPCYNFTWATDVYDVAPYPVGGVGRDYELWVCGSDPSGQPKYPPRSTSATSSTRGIWYSTNAGSNWQAYTMGDFDLRSLVVIHKTNNPHLYATTSDGEIYKSTNYGVDWSLNYSTGVTVRLIRVNYSNNYIFLATNNGVYRTTDEGGNWSTANNGLGTDLNVQSISIQPNSNTIFAGTVNSIYKSTNNGDTWVNVGGMNCSSVDASGNLVWTVTRDNAYTGKFNGTSWSTVYVLNAGNPFSSEHIYRNPSNNNIFISGAQNNTAYLYRSQDNGESYGAVYFPATGTSKFNGTIVHPTITENMYLYGGGSVGGTWKNLFYSTNGGSNWQAMDVSLGSGNNYVNDLVVLLISSIEIRYAALSNGEVYRYNGTAWGSAIFNMGNGQSATTLSVNPNQSSVVYAGGSNGIWKSTNSGSSFFKLSTPFTNVKRILLHPSYPNSAAYLWVIADNGNKIYNTTDGGSSWTEINTDNLPKPITDLKRDPQNNALIYAATSSGVYKIDPAPEAPTGVSGSINQDDHPVLSWTANPESDIQSYKIRRYLKWCACIKNKTGVIELVCEDTHGSGAYITNDIYTTSYTDETQTIITENICELLSEMPDMPDKPAKVGYYIVAKDGGNNISPLSSEVEIGTVVGYDAMEKNGHQKQDLPTKYSLEANYPNPFNPVTDIRYGLPEAAHVTLKVYDVLGREVAVLVNELQEAGYKEAEFDASNLASGVYYYKLVAGNFTKICKMILAK